MTLAKKGSKAFLSKSKVVAKLQISYIRWNSTLFEFMIAFWGADLTATAIDITFRICWPLRLISWSKIKNVISVAYLQIGLDFTSKTSTVLYIVVSAISANKTCYMMMFLPLRGPPSFGWADHSNHHLFHCSHISTMTLNAQLLLCIPTCPCPASQQLGGQSLTTLTKFCPLMTTYLHLWLEITLQVQGKTWIPMKFPVPPTYLNLST